MLRELKGLQLVCSSVVVDREKTTAELRVAEPIRKEKMMVFDKPWEGNHCCYGNVVYTGEKYYLYYLAWDDSRPWQEIRVCVLESVDGISWERPVLGIKEFEGSKENNIIIFFG